MIMTTYQRRAIRQRKERNQKIIWWLQDAIGALAIFGGLYAALIIGFAFSA
jgi:hypothetical protein